MRLAIPFALFFGIGVAVAELRSNTFRRVNTHILTRLREEVRNKGRALDILDAPCGEGKLAKFCLDNGIARTISGVDYVKVADSSGWHFTEHDLSKPLDMGQKFDVVTCVSGVMEFENTYQFIDCVKKHLTIDGVFLLTNDNIHSIRDRLSFLFLNRFHRFALLSEPEYTTHKVVSLPDLRRSLKHSGFDFVNVQYVVTHFEDWLMLPLALLFVLPQWLYLALEKSRIPLRQRFELFPIRSLIARHYIIEAKLKA